MFFVDTGFLFALASTKDPDHERVREVFEEFDPERLPEALRAPSTSLSKPPLVGEG
jgi:predicted nucleic acid-binding protein